MSKISTQSSKTNKKPQIHNLTKDGVKWLISKSVKIRDQGMY